MRLLCIALAALCLPLEVGADEVGTPAVADQLVSAKSQGRTVFLLVKEPSARKVKEMRAVAVEAQRRTPNSTVIELDRSQKSNQAIVKRYGLAGTVLPLTLIIAGNGAPAGGVTLGGDTLKRMLALVPTPRKADTLLALFERKAVFVVVARPSMAEAQAVLTACRDAATALKGKGPKERAAVVYVNLDDAAEKAFLDVLGVDAKSTEVVTHVYGFSGQKTAVLKGALKTEDLTAAAKKKTECCPGGKCG